MFEMFYPLNMTQTLIAAVMYLDNIFNNIWSPNKLLVNGTH